MDHNRLAAVALAALELLPAEPSDLANLLADDDQAAALSCLQPDDASTPLTRYLCEEIDHGRLERWEKELFRLGLAGVEAPVLAGSTAYPALLGACWDRPPFLFVKGALPTSDARWLAIIGSRAADDVTLAATRSVSRAVADTGAVVVSGLAAGVDTAAHEGALDARGATVAVMGTGIRHVYPETNIHLADRVAACGALVSQFAPGAPRTSTSFLRRNQVIAGMSHASLVMDGSERSGSRHEAEQALRFGRTVLLWEPSLAKRAWAQTWVRDGQAHFVADIDAVLDRLKQTA